MNQFLKDAAEFCRKNDFPVYRMAVIDDEGEPEEITIRNMNACMDSYSVAKAFTVAAAGFLVDRDLLSVDEKITDILTEEGAQAADQRWHNVTVDMALTHRIGLPAGFLDIDAINPLTFGQDYLSYLFRQPLAYEPGTQSVYTDAAFYLLSCVIEKRANMTLDNFLWENLFAPLSFREAAWSHCPKGHAMGATGLYVYTADMAKLGALYLGAGSWKGKQILSKEWVQTVLKREYEFHKTGYGASYGKGGMYGQMLLVIPEKNRVVAWHGFDDIGKDYDPLIRFAACYDPAANRIR